jgi:hypothetical protein
MGNRDRIGHVEGDRASTATDIVGSRQPTLSISGAHVHRESRRDELASGLFANAAVGASY